MDKKIKVININNIDYFIMKEVKLKDISYVFLSNPNNPTDMMIRKKNNKSNELGPLKDEDEFNKACLLLFKDK